MDDEPKHHEGVVAVEVQKPAAPLAPVDTPPAEDKAQFSPTPPDSSSSSEESDGETGGAVDDAMLDEPDEPAEDPVRLPSMAQFVVQNDVGELQPILTTEAQVQQGELHGTVVNTR